MDGTWKFAYSTRELKTYVSYNAYRHELALTNQHESHWIKLSSVTFDN